MEITDNSLRYERDTVHIAAEAAVDGIYVIRTSVTYELFDSPQTVRAYQNFPPLSERFAAIKRSI